MLSVPRKMTSGLFVPNKRTIGGIPAQVTVRETERDELQITDHPVEQGAPVSDHAYKRPSEVQIRAGWSVNKSGNIGANGGIYGQLLGWQAARIPFDLHTGKRVYKDMLMQSLTVTTDEQSEYALMADIVCRQVIIVATKTSQAKALSNNSDNQKSPENNATPTEKGSQPSRALEKSSNESDLGGGSNESDLRGTSPAGEESLRSDSNQSDLTTGNTYNTPEAQKVEGTVIKNDPNGAVQEQKGIGGMLPGQFRREHGGLGGGSTPPTMRQLLTRRASPTMRRREPMRRRATY